jgi:H2-forming N5,N10-methylenetetrahydromethanopterin dehydrogenase-like enzyme
MVSFLSFGNRSIIRFRNVVLPLPRKPVIKNTCVVSAMGMIYKLRLNNDYHKEDRAEKLLLQF